jgi:putative flippase GtrA
MALAATFLRHQANSLVATTVDFTVMIAIVSIAVASPTVGTAVGASCGAFVNFLLARFWVFRSTTAGPFAQAGRYAVVSAGSLVLNTAAMHLFTGILEVPYVAARAAISFVVSVAWNFPLQRVFVFEAHLR